MHASGKSLFLLHIRFSPFSALTIQTHNTYNKTHNTYLVFWTACFLHCPEPAPASQLQRTPIELHNFMSQKPGFSITESFLKFVDLSLYRGFSLELNGPRMPRIPHLLFALIPPCVDFSAPCVSLVLL